MLKLVRDSEEFIHHIMPVCIFSKFNNPSVTKLKKAIKNREAAFLFLSNNEKWHATRDRIKKLNLNAPIGNFCYNGKWNGSNGSQFDQ